eukprot:5428913-Alexandrium_andersonii.AAC.1
MLRGIWSGGEVEVSLSRAGPGLPWGKYSAYFFSSGPEQLVGQRVVACTRQSGGSPMQASGRLEVQPGDVLY